MAKLDGTLTLDRLREMLSYDPETGIFRRKTNSCARFEAGTIAGGVDKKGYRRIRIDYKSYGAGRLALFYMNGVWPKHDAEHKNGIHDDNRIDNLRDLPHELNCQNLRSAKSNNTIGVLGVRKRWNKWQAKICHNGKQINLGMHDSPGAAHAAYVAAKRRIHAGCTI